MEQKLRILEGCGVIEVRPTAPLGEGEQKVYRRA